MKTPFQAQGFRVEFVELPSGAFLEIYDKRGKKIVDIGFGYFYGGVGSKPSLEVAVDAAVPVNVEKWKDA